MVGSPRPAATLRFASGHVRAFADASGRPPLCEPYVRSAPRAVRRLRGASKKGTSALARMCGGRGRRRGGVSRREPAWRHRVGGCAWRTSAARTTRCPRSGANVGPRTAAGDRQRQRRLVRGPVRSGAKQRDEESQPQTANPNPANCQTAVLARVTAAEAGLTDTWIDPAEAQQWLSAIKALRDALNPP